MARIAGIDIPREKRVVISLTYVYGIGRSLSEQILKDAHVSEDTRVKDLTHEQVAAIQKYITNNYKVEGELKKEVTMNIQRLQEIGSYRGLRHKKSLPTRGQSKKTNASTIKGHRKTENIVQNKKIRAKK